MFIYNLSIFLTSTASVSTNAKYVLFAVFVFCAVKDFDLCYEPIDEFGCQFI